MTALGTRAIEAALDAVGAGRGCDAPPECVHASLSGVGGGRGCVWPCWQDGPTPFAADPFHPITEAFCGRPRRDAAGAYCEAHRARAFVTAHEWAALNRPAADRSPIGRPGAHRGPPA